MRPIHAILALEAAATQLRRPLYRKGIELSLMDADTVIDVYQQWICVLYDLHYLSPLAFKRDSTRLLDTMLSKDVYDLNLAMTELRDCIINRVNRGFKALCRRVSPHLYHLIKEDLEFSLLGDVYTSKKLVQLFSYTSRLSLCDIDLTQECLEEYMMNESLICETFPNTLVQSLNSIIRYWTRSFDPSNLNFRHSNGSIAHSTNKTLDYKYKNLQSDELIRYVFKDHYLPEDNTNTLDRCSQTIFVPKSFKTFRTISKEPATLQYLQQGVWLEIDRMVHADKWLRRHIDFHNQNRNGQLALAGSKDRYMATLDLSAASDSVSYVLVKKLFKGTKLLPYLIATRSRETLLPDGRRIRLKKFSPMGSSLCFPIETLIFASICQLVTRSLGSPGRFSVYGDDIIVPHDCAYEVTNVLSQLGFRLNMQKSYYRLEDSFRESCGIEAIDGVDITPIRVSRKYKSDPNDESRFTRHISSANEAYLRQYDSLRTWFVHKLQSEYKVLFSSTSLIGYEMTNYHLKQRWNPFLQRLEVKAHAITSIPRKGSDEIGYRHWLERTSIDRNTNEDTVSINSRYAFWRCLKISEVISKNFYDFEARTGRPTKIRIREVWQEKPYHWSDQPLIDFHIQHLRGKPLNPSAGKVLQ